jgi:hypothetical protein
VKLIRVRLLGTLKLYITKEHLASTIAVTIAVAFAFGVSLDIFVTACHDVETQSLSLARYLAASYEVQGIQRIHSRPRGEDILVCLY